MAGDGGGSFGGGRRRGRVKKIGRVKGGKGRAGGERNE